MRARLSSWWQQINQHRMWSAIIIVASVLVIALIVVVVLGYWLNWSWVGVSGGNSKITTTTTATEQPPAKTLWDWLGLLGVLAIPVVVGIGAAWFTAQQGKVADRENTDNQRETALQAYIDKLSELLLEKQLRGSQPDDEVRKIARVRTLTILPRLDAKRKRSVLQFLREAGLIDRDKCIIDLSGGISEGLLGADLSGVMGGINLSGTNLSGTNLSKANLLGDNLRGTDLSEADLEGAKLSLVDLSGANMHKADLSGTDLWGATLVGADLSGAYMDNADLTGAKLMGATLVGADLSGANLLAAELVGADLNGANLKGANLFATDLSEANLSRAKVTEEQLKEANSLKGATMADGSIHP
jgi:hypothetical protein